jgi:hypothetical protein
MTTPATPDRSSTLKVASTWSFKKFSQGFVHVFFACVELDELALAELKIIDWIDMTRCEIG